MAREPCAPYPRGVSEHPAATPYERIGGAASVRKLVDRFYDLMHALPEAATIRAMHPENMQSSRQKLFEFLSGWLGGPPLFMERHGHPRLRMRHMHFAIDDGARDAWILCMQRAMDECIEDALLKETLRGAFLRMASHLRNVGEFQRPEE
jgi:hemoglobin